MSVWRVRGPAPPLVGRVALPGGKNAALPLVLAAAGLPGVSTLHAVPAVGDVQAALALVASTGAALDPLRDGAWRLGPSASGAARGPTIRSTPVLLAALVGRHGAAEVPTPGGCAIGARPIDLHLDVLRTFGVAVDVRADRLLARGGPRPAHVRLPFPSTTATQVALLLAAAAPGTSRLEGLNPRAENAALVQALSASGVAVSAQGPALHVTGPASRGLDATVAPTLDEAALWWIAGLVTGGRIAVAGAPGTPAERDGLAQVLARAGGALEEAGECHAPAGLRAFQAAFGGATVGSDLHPAFAALALAAPGESVIEDVRFPERLAYVRGLQALGADVSAAPGRVVVRGGAALHGARVVAPDLRGGAALLLAALQARGETEIAQAQQVARGVSDWPGRLRALGVDIEEGAA